MTHPAAGQDPIHLRRELLAPAEAPGRTEEYVVEIAQEISHKALGTAPMTLTIRYIPDKWMVNPAPLKKYLAACEKEKITSMEALADMVVNDLHNELVPLFLEVEFFQKEKGGYKRILRHEQQPDWEGTTLISRLRPI